jgi:hypothetical protein
MGKIAAGDAGSAVAIFAGTLNGKLPEVIKKRVIQEMLSKINHNIIVL